MLGRASEAILTGRGRLQGFLRGSVKRRGIRVLLYHGVVEKKTDPVLERNQQTLDGFRAQMRYLKRFRVVGMDELLDALDRPSAEPASAAMVTFDDGFANNLEAAEVLSRLRLPWSLFVSVGEVGTNRTMWLPEFSLLMLHGDAARVDVEGAVWPLKTREERETSHRQLRGRLKALAAGARNEAMERIRAQFPAGETERLLDRFPSMRMLDWAQLRQLAAAGVEIGSHGVHHEAHHANQPAADRLRELCQSRHELDSRLSRPCRSFAYPNGDFVPESPQELAGAGYSVAFTTQEGTVDGTASRYLLPRLSVRRSLDKFVRSLWWCEKPPSPAPRTAPGAVGA
jgi:peptidoglycan/xylan/chitin deacetylase (PgdA/CDA1 family)